MNLYEFKVRSNICILFGKEIINWGKIYKENKDYGFHIKLYHLWSKEETGKKIEKLVKQFQKEFKECEDVSVFTEKNRMYGFYSLVINWRK